MGPRLINNNQIKYKLMLNTLKDNNRYSCDKQHWLHFGNIMTIDINKVHKLQININIHMAKNGMKFTGVDPDY